MFANPLAVQVKSGSMSDTSHGIALYHPMRGWLPVSMLNATEICLEDSDAGEYLWYALEDIDLVSCPVKNSVGIQQWFERVSA